MPTLLEDFEAIVACALPAPHDAYSPGDPAAIARHVERCGRVRDFIKMHQPWLPRKLDGFGEWIEYDGTNGPRIDEIVLVLDRENRARKMQPLLSKNEIVPPAHEYGWSEVVAFCRRESAGGKTNGR